MAQVHWGDEEPGYVELDQFTRVENVTPTTDIMFGGMKVIEYLPDTAEISKGLQYVRLQMCTPNQDILPDMEYRNATVTIPELEVYGCKMHLYDVSVDSDSSESIITLMSGWDESNYWDEEDDEDYYDEQTEPEGDTLW